MTKRVRIAFALSLLLDGSSFGQGGEPRTASAGADAGHAESPAEARAKASVVLISAEYAGESGDSGAGIIVSASRGLIYIVTADHVVRRRGKAPAAVRVTLRWTPGKDVVASLLPKHDGDGDLAVLTVGASAAFGPRARGELVPLVRDPRSLVTDESVILLGNPDGHPWQTYGRAEGFTSVNGDRIEFESAHLRHGHSGGALYDTDFQLVGMVFVDSGTSGYAETVDSIERRLRGWGYPCELHRPHRTLSAGGSLTCDAKGGRSLCWGDTSFGDVAPEAGTVRFEGDPIKAVAAGLFHGCALTREGQVYCLGANKCGQVGNSSTADVVSVATAIRTERAFQSLTAGGWHTCALTASGAAYCWGCGQDGRLGDDLGRDSATPGPVAGPVRFVALSAGLRNTCGLSSTGKAYCWGGINGTGAPRGGADPPNAFVPREVPGGLRFTSLSAGWMTCGLTGEGQLYCWGLTDRGDDTPRPMAPAVRFRSISVSLGDCACGVAIDGRAFCWGDNTLGKLGNGTQVSSDAPVPVAGGLKFESVSAGLTHACGVTTDDAVYCWGELYGPSERDGRRETSVPVKVLAP